MQRMARHNLYIRGQVFVKRGQLRGLARRLSSNDGTDLGGFSDVSPKTKTRPIQKRHTRSILGDYPVDHARLYTV